MDPDRVAEGGGVGLVELYALSTGAGEGDAQAGGGGGDVGVERGKDWVGDLLGLSQGWK